MKHVSTLESAFSLLEEVQEPYHLQSSQPWDRVMKNFVYSRISTQKVLTVKQMIWQRRFAACCDGGLWKLGTIPGGGFKPGDRAIRVAFIPAITPPGRIRYRRYGTIWRLKYPYNPVTAIVIRHKMARNHEASRLDPTVKIKYNGHAITLYQSGAHAELPRYPIIATYPFWRQCLF